MELEDATDVGTASPSEEGPDQATIVDFARREVHYEFVDGIALELPPMSAPSAELVADLGMAIGNYGIVANRGKAFIEMLIKLPFSPKKHRRPDCIFVPYTRWPKGKRLPNVNAWEILPDLCVEVLSPTDKMEDVLSRVKEFLDGGVQSVWVVSPILELVQVYRAINRIEVFTREQILTAEDLLPGFSLNLADLFPVPDPTFPS